MTLCMVLDDDETARYVASKVLHNMGLQPIQMHDSERALTSCKEATPDIIVLDIMMPNLDGIEFLKELRKIQGGGRTYVIACTARNDVETVEKMGQAGVNDYIIKPFEPELLEKKIRNSGLI